jgi:hypothetical protein
LDWPDARNINIDARSLQNQPDREQVMREYGKARAAAHHAKDRVPGAEILLFSMTPAS